MTVEEREPLDWSRPDALAAALHARFPRRDPLTLRFPDLERWVREIAGFPRGVPPPTPGQLEAVQASWHARFSGTA